MTALALDSNATATEDLRVIIPVVLLVVLIVLMLLLRSIVAPLLLIGTVVLSYAATLGVSALVFNHLLDFPGADPSVPLFGFVFLVALGVDYNIFLMTRVREESLRIGTRPGIVRGVAGDRRRDHRGRHRARRDLLGAAGDPDPVPGADLVHRRVRRAARHDPGALAAGAGAVVRHRAPHLVAVEARARPTSWASSSKPAVDLDRLDQRAAGSI